jgi:hypothetical protein
MIAVPESTKLPLASGVPAEGRTLTFCQVSEQVTPPLLADVTVNVSLFAVLDVMATDVPLAAPLMFNELAPDPPTRVIRTVGAVPPVLKMNPAGALRMMVPVPTLPLWISV